MQFQLEYRPYSRKLRTPLKMSRGVISQRDGVLVRLEDSAGNFSFGEAIMLSYFGTETLEESCAFLASWQGRFTSELLNNVPQRMPSTYYALETALLLLQDPRFADVQASDPASLSARKSKLDVSYLLPSGQRALSALARGKALGYRTFKWKIGVEPCAQELEILDLLLAELAADENLRLDANGGLSMQDAQEWLRRCEGTKVQFLEQPLAPNAVEETIALALNNSTPVALDESVARVEDIIRCYEIGFRGIFVIKPSRLGSLRAFLQWSCDKPLRFVYSSALETSIGTELGLRLAALDVATPLAVGYGVGQWFEEDGFDLHPAAAVLQPWALDVKQLAAVWENCAR